MKKINNLLKVGAFAAAISILAPSDTNYNRIPLEKKLREIEQDKNIPNVIDCKHKVWRYYINARSEGHDMNIIIGWTNNSNSFHAYLKDNEGRIFDPTWKTNKDGATSEKGIERRDIYIFGKNATIEDFVYYRNYKSKNELVHRKFNATKSVKKKRTIPLSTIVEGIKDYCRQDSAAWKYYQENIESQGGP